MCLCRSRRCGTDAPAAGRDACPGMPRVWSRPDGAPARGRGALSHPSAPTDPDHEKCDPLDPTGHRVDPLGKTRIGLWHERIPSPEDTRRRRRCRAGCMRMPQRLEAVGDGCCRPEIVTAEGQTLPTERGNVDEETVRHGSAGARMYGRGSPRGAGSTGGGPSLAESGVRPVRV